MHKLGIENKYLPVSLFADDEDEWIDSDDYDDEDEDDDYEDEDEDEEEEDEGY